MLLLSEVRFTAYEWFSNDSDNCENLTLEKFIKNRLPSYIPNMSLAGPSKVRQTCVEISIEEHDTAPQNVITNALFLVKKIRGQADSGKAFFTYSPLSNTMLYTGGYARRAITRITIYIRKNYVMVIWTLTYQTFALLTFLWCLPPLWNLRPLPSLWSGWLLGNLRFCKLYVWNWFSPINVCLCQFNY